MFSGFQAIILFKLENTDNNTFDILAPKKPIAKHIPITAALTLTNEINSNSRLIIKNEYITVPSIFSNNCHCLLTLYTKKIKSKF